MLTHLKLYVGTHIEMVAMEQRRTSAHIVRHHAQFLDQVVRPDDVPIVSSQLIIGTLDAHVLGFRLKWSVIAIGLTPLIQTPLILSALSWRTTVTVIDPSFGIGIEHIDCHDYSFRPIWAKLATCRTQLLIRIEHDQSR